MTPDRLGSVSTNSGVGVVSSTLSGVGVGVWVGVTVGVGVWVGMGVLLGVTVGVAVGLAVSVWGIAVEMAASENRQAVDKSTKVNNSEAICFMASSVY
jgi:hypothetical protein